MEKQYQYLEPFPYGDEFDSIQELRLIIERRRTENLQLYGHAVCWPSNKRVAIRIGLDGTISAGVHCEWI